MPNVVVYVPAERWRELSQSGDPAGQVREHVRSWLANGHRDLARPVEQPLASEHEHLRHDPKPSLREHARR